MRPPAPYDPTELVASLPLIVTVIDPVSFRIRFENGAAQTAFGPCRDALCYETIVRGDRPCGFCKMREVVETGEPRTSEICDGNRHFLVTWSAVSSREGQRHVVETILDITERKRAEEALKRSEHRFRFFMDNSPVVAFVKAADGTYIYGNKTMRATFSEERFLGKKDEQMMPPERAAALRRNDEAVLRANVPQQFIEQVPTPDGALRDWLVLKFPLDDGGEGGQLGGVAFDITSQTRARAELEETNAQLARTKRTLEEQVQACTSALDRYQETLRSLTFDARMAEERQRKQLAAELHDTLAQWMVLCKLKLATLLKKTTDDVTAREFQEVQMLVEEALTYTRTLMTDLRPMLFGSEHDLGTAIDWVVDRMRRLGLTVVVRDDGATKVLDDDVLTVTYRAVLELLYNVLKHSGAREATLVLRRAGSVMKVDVIDCGCGFASERPQPHTGGGLGLLNIREQLRSVRGRLEMTSQPGAGTHACIVVPLALTSRPAPSAL